MENLTKAEELVLEALQAYKTLHERAPEKVRVSFPVFDALVKEAVGEPGSISDRLYTPNGWDIILDKELNGNQVICE